MTINIRRHFANIKKIDNGDLIQDIREMRELDETVVDRMVRDIVKLEIRESVSPVYFSIWSQVADSRGKFSNRLSRLK